LLVLSYVITPLGSFIVSILKRWKISGQQMCGSTTQSSL
jgi:hypothetical protein